MSDVISAYGLTKTAEAWATNMLCRVSLRTLRRRIGDGWPAERALSEPASDAPVDIVPHEGKHSQYRGVTFHRPKKRWLAQIRIDGTLQQLGYYTDEAAAARAYDRKAIEARGNDAKVNFPAEWGHILDPGTAGARP